MNSVSKSIDTLPLKYIVNVVGIFLSESETVVTESLPYRPVSDSHSVFNIWNRTETGTVLSWWTEFVTCTCCYCGCSLFTPVTCVWDHKHQAMNRRINREYNCNYTVFSVKIVWIWSEAGHNFKVFVQTWSNPQVLAGYLRAQVRYPSSSWCPQRTQMQNAQITSAMNCYIVISFCAIPFFFYYERPRKGPPKVLQSCEKFQLDWTSLGDVMLWPITFQVPFPNTVLTVL